MNLSALTVLLAVAVSIAAARNVKSKYNIQSTLKKVQAKSRDPDFTGGQVSQADLAAFFDSVEDVAGQSKQNVEQLLSTISGNTDNSDDALTNDILSSSNAVFKTLGGILETRFYAAYNLVARLFFLGLEGSDQLCDLCDEQCVKEEVKEMDDAYDAKIDELDQSIRDAWCGNLGVTLFSGFSEEDADEKAHKQRSFQQRSRGDDSSRGDEDYEDVAERLTEDVIDRAMLFMVKPDTASLRQAFADDLQCLVDAADGVATFIGGIKGNLATASDEEKRNNFVEAHIRLHVLAENGRQVYFLSQVVLGVINFKPLNNGILSWLRGTVDSTFGGLQTVFDAQSQALQQAAPATGGELLTALKNLQGTVYEEIGAFDDIQDLVYELLIRAYVRGFDSDLTCDLSTSDPEQLQTCLEDQIMKAVQKYKEQKDVVRDELRGADKCDNLKDALGFGQDDDDSSAAPPERDNKSKGKGKGGKGGKGEKGKGRGEEGPPRIDDALLDMDIPTIRDAIIADVSCLADRLADFIDNLPDFNALSPEEAVTALMKIDVLMEGMWRKGERVFEAIERLSVALELQSPSPCDGAARKALGSNLKNMLHDALGKIEKRKELKEKKDDYEGLSKMLDRARNLLAELRSQQNEPSPAKRGMGQATLKKTLLKVAAIGKAKIQQKSASEDSSPGDDSGDSSSGDDSNASGSGDDSSAGADSSTGDDTAKELKSLKKILLQLQNRKHA